MSRDGDGTPPRDRKGAATGARHGVIVEDLGVGIVSGRYRAGDPLPPLDDLRDAYWGASRPTIREALRVLAAKGLVRPLQRVGTLVQPRESWQLLDHDVLRWLRLAEGDDRILEQIMAVRLMIEPEIAAAAARHATPADIDRIAAALRGMSAARGTIDSVQPDLDFHQAVARAGHNEIALRLIGYLLEPLRGAFEVTLAHPQAPGSTVPRHQAILTAIELRDPDGAREAARRQLLETQHMLTEVTRTESADPTGPGTST